MKLKGKRHPLADEVEQLEPEQVMWLFSRGYAAKDKQATRITEEGNTWLHENEAAVSIMLTNLISQRMV